MSESTNHTSTPEGDVLLRRSKLIEPRRVVRVVVEAELLTQMFTTGFVSPRRLDGEGSPLLYLKCIEGLPPGATFHGFSGHVWDSAGIEPPPPARELIALLFAHESFELVNPYDIPPEIEVRFNQTTFDPADASNTPGSDSPDAPNATLDGAPAPTTTPDTA